eukprot:g5955.t1
MAEETPPSSGVNDCSEPAGEENHADSSGGGMFERAPFAGHQAQQRARHDWPRGDAVLQDVQDAADDGDIERGAVTVTAVKDVIEKHPLPVEEALAAFESGDDDHRSTTFFSKISTPGDGCHVARAWAEVFSAALQLWQERPSKMTNACTAGFATCCAKPDPRQHLCAISMFFAYGAEVKPEQLIELAKLLRPEELKRVFLGGVACVDNPFVPGVSLSVALKEALKNSPERESTTLKTLHESLDELILEILERLPQSISDFPGGVKGCEDIFEPEVAGIVRGFTFRGPLKLALQERQFSETLCVAPLMYKYMSYRFVAGLPNASDSKNLLDRPKSTTTTSTATMTPSSTIRASRGETRASSPPTASATTAGETATAAAAAAAPPPTVVVSSSLSPESRKGQDYLYVDGFVADSEFGRLMQGLGFTGWRANPSSNGRPASRDMERIFHGTILPGAQFIIIGVLTRPASYYKVPAVRMALSFYVHLVMLALFTTVVLEDDDGKLSNTETFLIFHVLTEILSNLVRMWKNFVEYTRNKWNWLECVSLALMAGGLFVRVVDSDVHVGRGLFALSAPLVFSRVLFFGQIWRRQGLVIQMMIILVGEMMHFGMVLGTIMMGFTVSFYALFREERIYGELWLDVFKAMLGEVGVFEELYDDSVHRNVAKVLLVFYLIFVSVMLLNLLIAVLSTEHAKLEQQQDRAFRQSKVRLMKLYGRMVEGDQLPTPFNSLQLVLSFPFIAHDYCFGGNTGAKIAHEFGVGITWFMLGPPALLIAWGLWVVSVPAAVLRVWRSAKFTGRSLMFATGCSFAVVAFHTLVLPFVTVLLWGISGFGLILTVLRELLASLCCNGAAACGGDDDAVQVDDNQRRARRGAADASGDSADGVNGAACSTSVAQILRNADDTLQATAGRRRSLGNGGGGWGGETGLSVAKIVDYLEDPEAPERRKQQEQAATWGQVARIRNQLDAAGEARTKDILDRLESVITLVQQRG